MDIKHMNRKQLSTAAFFLTMSLFSATAGQPANAEAMVTFGVNNYSISYPPSWGAPTIKTVKALALMSPGDVPDDVAPEHTEIHFSKSKAAICLYPVKDWKSTSFKKKYAVVSDAVDSLKGILAKHPTVPKDVPLLPWGDVSTPFYAHVKYLDNKTASAIRFVGQYNTECVEINNEALTYTSQGLSKDGQTYISIVIPVTSKVLPAKDSSATWKNDKYHKFMEAYDAYTGPVGRKLNAESESAFKPSLVDLDAISNSIVNSKK